MTLTHLQPKRPLSLEAYINPFKIWDVPFRSLPPRRNLDKIDSGTSLWRHTAMKFRLLLPLLAALAQSCEDKSRLTAADYTPSEHRHAGAGRLTVDGRLLRLDGRPFLMRGVTYAPTPPGDDPGWVSADYLSSAYTSMHVRDLSLMEQMGLNTIRLYGAGAVEAGRPASTTWSPTAASA